MKISIYESSAPNKQNFGLYKMSNSKKFFLITSKKECTKNAGQDIFDQKIIFFSEEFYLIYNQHLQGNHLQTFNLLKITRLAISPYLNSFS